MRLGLWGGRRRGGAGRRERERSDGTRRLFEILPRFMGEEEVEERWAWLSWIFWISSNLVDTGLCYLVLFSKQFVI